MGSKIATSVSFNLPSGQEVTIETGKLATQAHGSVVVKIQDTMIFCSVVSSTKDGSSNPFFPLSVDYQEKFAAAGRIPGNFFRREARLSENEILISRLVDRAIRPLFPDGYMNETQVIINLISGDDETMPDGYAALAASAALATSNIAFDGPLSEVRVAKIDGEYKVNPLRSELENATLNIIVAANMDNVLMVEGEAKEAQESELIEAIKTGHDAIKVQCQAQLDLAQLVGDKALIKREFEPAPIDEDIYNAVKAATVDKILEVSRAALDKFSRKDGYSKIIDEYCEALEENATEDVDIEDVVGKSKKYFDKIKKETIREMVLSESIRLDGRKYDEVRPIWSEIDYLPAAHGSAIFNRGETQSLTSLTIGTKTDQMLIDNALDHHNESFILHYNFPALSVGETKPMRGPGRREIGHANLAGRSIKQVMPSDLPYTIRLVSDILESNGSSSMATVCAASLALCDGGIQITKPVSGIAMGMISDGTRHAVLSDILGDEDALGDMDFKLTGTVDGITACQMDIKIDGLPYEILEQALLQAKAGRIHILEEMAKTIAGPRPEMKAHAPRVTEVRIAGEFIGAVIGPGGKIIQQMQKETGTTISIEEDGEEGVIQIFSSDADGIAEAMRRIEIITHKPEVGNEYEATVASIKPFGIFVDFMNSGGLVHISEISHSRLESMDGLFTEGDKVKIKIIGIDPKTRKWRLSRKALLPKPEGYVEPEPRRDRGRRDDRRRDDRRRDDRRR